MGPFLYIQNALTIDMQLVSLSTGAQLRIQKSYACSFLLTRLDATFHHQRENLACFDLDYEPGETAPSESYSTYVVKKRMKAKVLCFIRPS